MRHEFVVVDEYLRGFTEVRALKAALETGMIDTLAGVDAMTMENLAQEGEMDGAGTRMLVDLLAAGGVVWVDGARAGLTERFRTALKYRDLLEAKIEMADYAAGDAIENFRLLMTDSAGFLARSRLMRLFDYSRFLDVTHESLVLARRWVKYTSALTRYEGEALLGMHDFARYGAMLDIGGNSGEFALAACARNPKLRATVFDLPAVCAVGREHVNGKTGCERIEFVAGDALNGDLPGGFDLAMFKSMLHDWPETKAEELIGRAGKSIKPGGTVLIFERGPAEASRAVGYGEMPTLLFFRSYRRPEIYQTMLKAAGLGKISVQWVELGWRFFLIVARRLSSQ